MISIFFHLFSELNEDEWGHSGLGRCNILKWRCESVEKTESSDRESKNILWIMNASEIGEGKCKEDGADCKVWSVGLVKY